MSELMIAPLPSPPPRYPRRRSCHVAGPARVRSPTSPCLPNSPELPPFRLAQLLEVAQYQHSPLARRKPHQHPDHRITKINRSCRVNRRAGPKQHSVPVPHPLTTPPIGGQVVQGAANVILRVAIDPPPMPQQPLQRRLQQVLPVSPAPRQQRRRTQQPITPLGDKPLQGAPLLVAVHPWPPSCHQGNTRTSGARLPGAEGRRSIFPPGMRRSRWREARQTRLICAQLTESAPENREAHTRQGAERSSRRTAGCSPSVTAQVLDRAAAESDGVRATRPAASREGWSTGPGAEPASRSQAGRGGQGRPDQRAAKRRDHPFCGQPSARTFNFAILVKFLVLPAPCPFSLLPHPPSHSIIQTILPCSLPP